jgi:hypothetical protein
MMEFTIVHWLLLILLGILALSCLILAIRLFNVEYPIEKRDQYRRSLKIGGLAAICFFIVVLIVGIFIWAETGVMKSIVLAFPILCMVPPIIAISVLGAYIQFFWYERLSEYRDDLIKKQIERFESNNQEPLSE